MKIKDWQIIFKTVGKQLSFTLLCGIWSLVLYLIVDMLPRIEYFRIFIPIVKGVTLFLTAYYFVYCILLTKKIIDKYYR